jgi:transcriptional regulator with XRE-family HTH domain
MLDGDAPMKAPMVHDWKERLLAAIEADGRSARAISLASDLGPNFVTQFREGREPGVKQVIKLADTLGVSLAHLFLGDDITAQDEEFFRLLRDSTPEGREAVLTLLRSMLRPG